MGQNHGSEYGTYRAVMVHIVQVRTTFVGAKSWARVMHILGCYDAYCSGKDFVGRQNNWSKYDTFRSNLSGGIYQYCTF